MLGVTRECFFRIATDGRAKEDGEGFVISPHAYMFWKIVYMAGLTAATPPWSGQWGAQNKPGEKRITAQIFIKFPG